MTVQEIVLYANGYGVPENIITDLGYAHYLWVVIDAAEKAGGHATVFLAGGATDPSRPDKTEAGEMLRLAQELLPERCRAAVRFETLEDGLDLLGNLRAFAARVPRDVPVVMFCEHARQDRMRLLARWMFPKSRVVPVMFDRYMGHPILARLRQLPATALAVGSWLSPAFKRLVADPLRRRHMRADAVRRHARPSS